MLKTVLVLLEYSGTVAHQKCPPVLLHRRIWIHVSTCGAVSWADYQTYYQKIKNAVVFVSDQTCDILKNINIFKECSREN